jgi:hypothetical protein
MYFSMSVMVQLCYVCVFPRMANLWANIEIESNLQKMKQSKFVALHKVNVPQR